MSGVWSAKSLLSEADPTTWVFTGDSVTQGARHTNGWRDYTELFAERWRWELGRTRDVVINTAVSGRRITDLRDDLDHSVLRHRPTVVSLMFGLNDATAGVGGAASFRAAYEQVLRRLASESEAVVVLQTPNQSSVTDPLRHGALPYYVDVVRELGEAHRLTVVDHYLVWTELDPPDHCEYWISHGCHPNEYGHRVLAGTLLRTLDLGEQDLDGSESSVLGRAVP